MERKNPGKLVYNLRSSTRHPKFNKFCIFVVQSGWKRYDRSQIVNMVMVVVVDIPHINLQFHITLYQTKKINKNYFQLDYPPLLFWLLSLSALFIHVRINDRKQQELKWKKIQVEINNSFSLWGLKFAGCIPFRSVRSHPPKRCATNFHLMVKNTFTAITPRYSMTLIGSILRVL